MNERRQYSCYWGTQLSKYFILVRWRTRPSEDIILGGECYRVETLSLLGGERERMMTLFFFFFGGKHDRVKISLLFANETE